MATGKQAFHEAVAEKLIALIEAGTAPWQKPWTPGRSAGILPINPTTGKRYRGINTLQLMAAGYSDNRWMTYRQAAAREAQVRKGEHGTTIQYWDFGQPASEKEKEEGASVEKKTRPRVFFATVFNAEQIDGLPPVATPSTPKQGWDQIARAEEIIVKSGARIEHRDGDRAYYMPAGDMIVLPTKAQFPSAGDYYGTALHELGHWTGHFTRLDRDIGGGFGSVEYAKEELRAEIASMIISSELEIPHDTTRHAAYVKNWLVILKDDPLEIFRAAADAEKIQDYVLNIEKVLERKAALAADNLAKEKERPQSADLTR